MLHKGRLYCKIFPVEYRFLRILVCVSIAWEVLLTADVLLFIWYTIFRGKLQSGILWREHGRPKIRVRIYAPSLTKTKWASMKPHRVITWAQDFTDQSGGRANLHCMYQPIVIEWMCAGYVYIYCSKLHCSFECVWYCGSCCGCGLKKIIL